MNSERWHIRDIEQGYGWVGRVSIEQREVGILLYLFFRGWYEGLYINGNYLLEKDNLVIQERLKMHSGIKFFRSSKNRIQSTKEGAGLLA